MRMVQPRLSTDDPYAALVKKLLRYREVTYSRNSLWVGRRMFAFSSKDNLILKLPENRVDELISSGEGARYYPGRGKIQKEWLAVKPTRSTSLRLAKESNEVRRFKTLSFDQIRPVITIELNGGLIYSVTNIFSTDIHVI